MRLNNCDDLITDELANRDTYAYQKYIEIIQSHVLNIDDEIWSRYIYRALNGDIVGNGFNIITGEFVNMNDERDNILKLPREEFVRENTTVDFEPDEFVNPLLSGGVKIGEIEGHDVLFNSDGYYLFWNKDTEYFLESWLTFPAYPYNR